MLNSTFLTILAIVSSNLSKITIIIIIITITEQKLANQANQIRKKGWFSQADLEDIKQRSSSPARVKTRILKML